MSLQNKNRLPLSNKCQDERKLVSEMVPCYYKNKTSNSAKLVTWVAKKEQITKFGTWMGNKDKKKQS